VVSLAVILCSLGCSSGCGTEAEMTAGRAVEKAVASIEARGVDLENMTVTVTSKANTTIIVPVGTRFSSSASGTQNMISAGTIRFVFTSASPGSPQTLTQQIPVYCVNRFLDVPTSASQFTVSYSEETDPVRKLVECLETKSASHRARQLAVWMISDQLLELSPEQLANKFVNEVEVKWRAHATGPELAEILRESAPDTPAEVLDSITNMSADQVELVLESLKPKFRADAEAEVKRYAEQTGPLLRDCGYDLSSAAFFK
jgi:hypothetical protein